MNVIADFGYGSISSSDTTLKDKLVLGNHNPEEDFKISAHDIFEMLKALPKGVKWNPYTSEFVRG